VCHQSSFECFDALSNFILWKKEKAQLLLFVTTLMFRPKNLDCFVMAHWHECYLNIMMLHWNVQLVMLYPFWKGGQSEYSEK
jgi:hypothetical protein